MKFLFSLILLFRITIPIVADAANLSSSSTEVILVTGSTMSEEVDEKNSGEKQESPAMKPLPNDPETQQLPESITDHPSVIAPPVIDSDMAIPPPRTDPDMAVLPDNLPLAPAD